MLIRRNLRSVASLGAVALVVLISACQRNATVAPKKPVNDSSKNPVPVPEEVRQLNSTQDSTEEPVTIVTASGRELYLQHCAACHGEFGDGDGVAAPHLHPRPRNFRGGKFMLVSTESRFPSRADLDAVLVRGMPGSAMPSFAHLSQEERRRLVDEVLRLCRAGVRDGYVQEILRSEDTSVGEIDEQEIQEFVARRTSAGPITEVPDIPAENADSIERGKELYFAKNCRACHGDEGKGDGKKDMVDQDGLPTTPRDFTRGIFKGGHDPKSLYRRIAYGMPGSAMPSYFGAMTPEQIVDVVHYTLSLSNESMREAAILRRNRIVAKYIGQLPSSTDSETWNAVAPTQLRMTPLWWRQGADPDLSVQALHDGETLAFRLSWRDSTRDEPKFNSDQRADIAALELYRGDAEPFIGMGNFGSPVDVWRWTSRLPPPLKIEPTLSGSGDGKRDDTKTDDTSKGDPSESKPNVVEESKAQTDPGSDSGKKVEILSVEDQRRLASAITGYGAGSFDLEPSQLVHATGRWKNDRWTIELRRPLAIKNNLFGVSLEPGCNASVAFAIWNGSQGDSGGKKAITIWQDLHVEARTKQ